MRLVGSHGTAGWLGRVSALGVLTLALAFSGSTGIGLASARGGGPGNSGTLKVHQYGTPSGTPSGTHSNEPKVCAFNLEGFAFDPGQMVAVAFAVQGGDGPTGVLPDPNWFGPYTADSSGHFATAYLNHGAATLAAGHYKALAYGKNSAGAWVALDKAKSKVFKVACETHKGTVTVTKALAEGSQPAGGTRFPVTVTCTKADYAKTFTLAVGESATTQQLPAGTTCVVTEAQPTGWDGAAFIPASSITVPAGASATVRVVNNKPAPPRTHTGIVRVTKALAEGSQPAGGTVFPVTVTCAAAEYSHTFVLSVGESATTKALPAGVSCTVTEAQPAGWDTPTFTPSATVTVPACGTAKVKVVNNRPAPPPVTGTVTVTKVLAEGSQPAGETRFPVTVTCAAAEYSHTFVLSVGESATTVQLPAGVSCVVNEAQPAGWDTPTFTPSGSVTVPAGASTTVRVVNNKSAPPPQLASLALTKANSPRGAVSPGAVIAYTLTVKAGGNVSQDGVVVTDAIPAGTTYVAGSAACVPAGHLPCEVGYDAGTRTLTFAVGTMAPGDELAVTFSVRVDATVALTTTITNVGTVTSARAAATSNKVTNSIVAVLGEKLNKPGTGLSKTGAALPVGTLVAVGAGLLLAGLVLLAGARRRPRRT